MSQVQFTPDQFASFVASTCTMLGIKPGEFSQQIQRMIDTSGPPEEADARAKRTYTVMKPEQHPSTLEVGTIMFDANGRAHEVVEKKAFKGTCKKWGLIKATNKQVTVKVEPGLEIADTAVDTTVTEQPAIVAEDCDWSEGSPKVDATKAKRTYNSSKPEVDPREAGLGTTMESNGKVWFVAEVKTRGDGRRLLWKLNKETGEEQVEEIKDDGASVEEKGSKTKARKGPEETAKNFVEGDIRQGMDGKMYKCVVRTRKSKVDGGEPKMFHVWQKMAQ